jgi:hypothetical protein
MRSLAFLLFILNAFLFLALNRTSSPQMRSVFLLFLGFFVVALLADDVRLRMEQADAAKYETAQDAARSILKEAKTMIAKFRGDVLNFTKTLDTLLDTTNVDPESKTQQQLAVVLMEARVHIAAAATKFGQNSRQLEKVEAIFAEL